MTIHHSPLEAASRRAAQEQDSSRCTALDLELIRLVFSMPDKARAKLLAFLHLSQHEVELLADLAVSEAGEVHLALVSIPRAVS